MKAAMGMKLDNQMMDYTADDNIGVTKKEEENGGAEDTENAAATAPGSEVDAKKAKAAMRMSGQNPLMTLNEFKPSLAWECVELGHSPATRKFCMKTEIDGETYEGSGVSKKLAKQAAAKSILNKLYDMNFSFSGDNSIEGNTDSEMKVSVCNDYHGLMMLTIHLVRLLEQTSSSPSSPRTRAWRTTSGD